MAKKQTENNEARARMVAVGCRVPADVADKLKAAAAKQDRDVSWLVRRLLVEKYG